ncbi:MAG TPA: prepilin-type N-terminal cleavage/methylation domain-containing protein [Helicobacteraceae bacterium]|nr:prepilin-type N-terminal cleavage/methylation domain-containing protein [Helicobacteraceae bacterium]
MKYLNQRRNAFTLIELIFTITIIGILAAIAIPKMEATRSDAKISMEMSGISQIIYNLGSEFTSSSGISESSKQEAVEATKCFNVTVHGTKSGTPLLYRDGNVTVGLISSATNECQSIVLNELSLEARKNGILNNDGTSKTFVFTGSTVIR